MSRRKVNVYDIGDAGYIRVTFTAEDGSDLSVSDNIDTATFYVEDPDSNVTETVYPDDPEVSLVGTNKLLMLVRYDKSGWWNYRVRAESSELGTFDAAEGQAYVRPSEVLDR